MTTRAALQHDHASILTNSPFSQVDEAQFERLASLARHIRRPSGSILYEEGEAAVECYFVLDGVVEVFKRTEDGGSFILKTPSGGDFFGLDDVIASNSAYQSSARVITEAELWAVPREEMSNLLESAPAFAAEILSLIADHACSLRSRLTDFVEKPVSARLVETLDHLARFHGTPNGDGVKIKLSVTNQKLAEMVGSTPETVSTLLRDLKNARVIDRKGQTFVIRQPERLHAYVH